MPTRIEVRRGERRVDDSDWSPGDGRDELDAWALRAFGASGFGDGGIAPEDAFEVRQAARVARAATLGQSLLAFFRSLRVWFRSLHEWLRTARPRASALPASRVARVPSSQVMLRDVGLADKEQVRFALDSSTGRHSRSNLRTRVGWL
jgi:hypothetical protein